MGNIPRMTETTGSTASSKERAPSPGPAKPKGTDDTAARTEPALQYLYGIKFIFAFTCICIILFLVVLVSHIMSCHQVTHLIPSSGQPDQCWNRNWAKFLVQDGSIVSTAAPTITDEFKSLNDLGWYSSVYYMTFCIAQLQFGKLNVRYPIRVVYSCCMFLFLVGSAICGAAPNSPALTIGRAIAGIGSAGLLVGSFALIPVITPRLRRPLVTGIIGDVLGFGMSVGPMICGAFTEQVTWRWAFYMNLPIRGFCYFGFFF